LSSLVAVESPSDPSFLPASTESDPSNKELPLPIAAAAAKVASMFWSPHRLTNHLVLPSAKTLGPVTTTKETSIFKAAATFSAICLAVKVTPALMVMVMSKQISLLEAGVGTHRPSLEQVPLQVFSLQVGAVSKHLSPVNPGLHWQNLCTPSFTNSAH
jgi:hypothetical protein